MKMIDYTFEDVESAVIDLLKEKKVCMSKGRIIELVDYPKTSVSEALRRLRGFKKLGLIYVCGWGKKRKVYWGLIY